MLLIFKYAWFLFIAVTCINGAVWWRRGQQARAEEPELEEGYRRLIRWWIICGNLPWIVMGIGIIFGGVPSVLHYFNPRNGPFVMAFYVTIVALWIASFYWIFFRGGAEELVAHPGLLNLPGQKPVWVKALFLLSLIGGIIALTMMILGGIPGQNDTINPSGHSDRCDCCFVLVVSSINPFFPQT